MPEEIGKFTAIAAGVGIAAHAASWATHKAITKNKTDKTEPKNDTKQEE